MFRPLYCWSSSGDDVEWLCVISSILVIGDWCISVLALVINDLMILIVQSRHCSLSGLLWHQLAVVPLSLFMLSR